MYKVNETALKRLHPVYFHPHAIGKGNTMETVKRLVVDRC